MLIVTLKNYNYLCDYTRKLINENIEDAKLDNMAVYFIGTTNINAFLNPQKNVSLRRRTNNVLPSQKRSVLFSKRDH